MGVLLPFEAYGEQIRSQSLLRQGLTTGALFGVLLGLGMAVAAVIWPKALCPCGPPRWWLFALAAVAAGTLYGFRFPRSLRKRLLKQLRSAYDNTGAFATHPPAGNFSHRLPCNLKVGKWAV